MNASKKEQVIIRDVNSVLVEKEISDPTLVAALVSEVTAGVLKITTERSDARRNRHFEKKEKQKRERNEQSSLAQNLENQQSINPYLILDIQPAVKAKYFNDSEVWMSRALNHASHGLKLNEKRIVMFAAAKLLPSDSQANFSPRITIYAEDLAKVFGLNLPAARKAMKEADTGLKVMPSVERTDFGLSSRHIEQVYYDDNGDNPLTSMLWVDKTHYHEGHGKLDIWFCSKVVPHLTDLHKDFVKYNINDLIEVKSKHSFRIFEILLQHKMSKNTKPIEVEMIVDCLGLSSIYLTNPRLIRTDILLAAQEELHKSLPFTFEPITKGGKTVSFKFKFQKKAVNNLEIAITED